MERNSSATRYWIPLFLIACAWKADCQDPSLSPRDLFLDGGHSPPSQKGDAIATRRTERPLSVRFGLLRHQPDGSFRGVDPQTTLFYAGDRVRLRVQANQDANLVVLQHGSSGKWSVLYPRDSSAIEPLSALEVCEIPDSSGSFAFDNVAGEEQMVLIIARDPVSARRLVERLNNERPQLEESIAGFQVTTRGKSKEVLYEKVEHDERSGFDGAAFYAASREKDASMPLLIHLNLRHKAGNRK